MIVIPFIGRIPKVNFSFNTLFDIKYTIKTKNIFQIKTVWCTILKFLLNTYSYAILLSFYY